MSLPIQGLSASLCNIAPARIAWARAAAQRLSERGFETTIAPVRGDAGPWYRGEMLAYTPLRQPPPRGASGEELVRVLSAHEDVLAEVEQALGLAAEFAHFGDLADDWPVLTLRRDGEDLGCLAVLAEVTPPAEIAPAVAMRLAFVAARLPISDAEQLEAGDMLVLNHGPWPLAHDEGGALTRPDLPPLGYDPLGGRLVPILIDPTPVSKGASGAMSSSETPGGLSVPVAIHLADVAITQGELARMAETGTFDLGAVSEGLSAQLSVGGRSIGRGEIVRLGDRFAVLLDGSEIATAPSPDNETPAAHPGEVPAEAAGPETALGDVGNTAGQGS